LDEESNFDKATDLAFANKLKQHLKANPCYRGDREEFGIRHYAGEVSFFQKCVLFGVGLENLYPMIYM